MGNATLNVVEPQGSKSEPTPRIGRLPIAERELRRTQILRSAMAEIVERGYAGATTSRIAQRAGASKETLYAWFGNKAGLITALIEANADNAVPVPETDNLDHFYTISQAREALISCGEGLLRLLTSKDSIALNRAAMSSPQLAKALKNSGSGRTGPAIERYLAELDKIGLVSAPDPQDAFRLFFGLVIRDRQIKALLGTLTLTNTQCRIESEQAVDRFLLLLTPSV